jgi:DNA anti-recombination protein RmuC
MADDNDLTDGNPEESIIPQKEEVFEEQNTVLDQVVEFVEDSSEEEKEKKDALEEETEEKNEIDESQLGVLAESLLSTGEDMSKLLVVTGSLNDKLNGVWNNYGDLFKSYNHLIKKKDKHLLYLMACSIGVIVISLAIVLVMSFSFSKQVNNMNALSMSLAKRISEVNSGLVTFEELNATIRALDESTLQLAREVESQQSSVQAAVDQMANDTRVQVDQLITLLSDQISSLGTTLADLQGESQNQQNSVNQNNIAMQVLRSELEDMHGSVEQLIALRSSVDALVVLERERYLEAIQKKTGPEAESTPEEGGVISYFKSQN